MIPCTDFIPAYSELFRLLEERGGPAAVEAFWEYLADRFLTNLRELVAAGGLRGCWEYWRHSLTEEAADFVMELDEEAGEFLLVIRRCPSKARLRVDCPLRPYPDYCRHCDLLYRRVLEPLGYRYEIDLSEADQARCRIMVRRAPTAPRGSSAQLPP